MNDIEKALAEADRAAKRLEEKIHKQRLSKRMECPIISVVSSIEPSGNVAHRGLKVMA